MTPNSAPVTSSHEFIMADGVPDIFLILFSFFLCFSDFFQDVVFWLLCMLTVFGLLAGNLIFVHSTQHMRSASVFYCVVIFFSFLDMDQTVFL